MIAKNRTLPEHYTLMRPIGYMTSSARHSLSDLELEWIDRQWKAFEGGPDDSQYNVICELRTPQTHTRIWVVDRDGPESLPVLMLPEDY